MKANHIIPFQRTLTEMAKRNIFDTKLKFSGWKFTPQRAYMIYKETPNWNKYYLPFNPKGLTVLDVGAGEGETAKFYLEYGARRVLAVEKNPESYCNLQTNCVGHSVDCWNMKFHPSMLMWRYDVMKMDIEGYEETVLDHMNFLRPSVIEVHGLPLVEKFRDRGFRIVDTSECGASCNAMAYWMC